MQLFKENLLSKAKHSLAAMAQKKVCPRDKVADPPGTAVLPIDRHGFVEGFVYIVHCMVITYSRVWINRVRLPILLVVS